MRIKTCFRFFSTKNSNREQTFWQKKLKNCGKYLLNTLENIFKIGTLVSYKYISIIKETIECVYIF